MIHRTFRSLDQAPKLVGFTIGQWALLITDTTLVGGTVYLLALPGKAAISLLAFLVGLPAALMYVSEAGGMNLGGLLTDAVRWRVSTHALRARPVRRGRWRGRSRTASSLLDVASIRADGLLTRKDRTLLRYLEVEPVNPLVMDSAEAERVSVAFTGVAARLTDGQSLQLYTQAAPALVEELVAVQADRCRDAADRATRDGDAELSAALIGLGGAHERTLRDATARLDPTRFRHLLVCPWSPPRRGRSENTEEHSQQSLDHTEGIRSELEAAGLTARRLDGPEVLDLLAARFDPDRYEGGGPPVSLTDPDTIHPAAAGALQEVLCAQDLNLSDPGCLRIGGRVERTLFVSLAPEQTWLGWLLHAMTSAGPFTVSVHLTATERYRERVAQRRRYKRLYGVNRGVEARGRPVDPDARLQEQEAEELTDQLAASAGSGIYRLSVYVSLAEPDGDPTRLGELADTIVRELGAVCDARVQHGRFAQERLWRSTLPVGDDQAKRRRRYVSANVGDSFPLVGSECGSPDGIPLGLSVPGRSVERLDPFDPVHPNHLLLINGMSGAGKTMSALLLLARAISQGATGFIIDRAGHFDFLASLIPGAATVQLGAGGDAINCWTVEDPAAVSAEKVDYLLALHALLLGEHHQGRDSYGLTDLEANLLGLAIGDVYARCARTAEEPRELLLREELDRRYESERRDGSAGIAEALRNLSMRLSNYLTDGPYSYLTDRPSTIAAGAPLVVFDTRSIPDAKAAAALFVICEHVKSQIARTRATHLANADQDGVWAGRSFLVIDEAWKLIERPATGRWFNEFCRRSRHYALWLVAISQQLSDFENDHGRALLANAAMRLFLRQEARELAYVRETLGLSGEAIDAIGSLKTVRGEYATAYLMNGARGEGTVQIPVGRSEYWIASSDPARDEPRRRQALRDADGDPWRALQRLAGLQPGAPEQVVL